MFGKFFLISQKVGLKGAIFFRRSTPFAGAGNRADCDFVSKDADQNFRACPYNLKTTEVEIEHKWRWVCAAQRTVK